MPEPEPDRPATASDQARPIDLPKPTPPTRPRPPVGHLEPADLEHLEHRRPAPPPFDTVRAAFYLVASVIALQGVVVLVGVVVCAVYAAEIVANKFQCDAHDKLVTLLAEALAAALAFAGGFMRRP